MHKDLFVTPEEMAKLIVDVVESSGYFERNKKGHPEDIWIAMSTVGEAVSHSLSWAIHKER